MNTAKNPPDTQQMQGLPSKMNHFWTFRDDDACMVANKTVTLKDYPAQTRTLCLFCERRLDRLRHGHIQIPMKRGKLDKIISLCEDCAMMVIVEFFREARWR